MTKVRLVSRRGIKTFVFARNPLASIFSSRELKAAWMNCQTAIGAGQRSFFAFERTFAAGDMGFDGHSSDIWRGDTAIWRWGQGIGHLSAFIFIEDKCPPGCQGNNTELMAISQRMPLLRTGSLVGAVLAP